VYTDINLDLLKHIAKETWGKFFYVEKNADFAQIATSIQNALRRSEISTQTPIFIACNWYILFALIVMLLYVVSYKTYVILRPRSF
jgi:hypothetical protein